MYGIKHFENLIFDLYFLWKQTDVKARLIIKILHVGFIVIPIN
jgi:hypothetical protein